MTSLQYIVDAPLAKESWVTTGETFYQLSKPENALRINKGYYFSQGGRARLYKTL